MGQLSFPPAPFFAAKVPDPDFECISENVLDTWQKGNKTFKKFEYTIRLEFEGRVRIRAKNFISQRPNNQWFPLL